MRVKVDVRRVNDIVIFFECNSCEIYLKDFFYNCVVELKEKKYKIMKRK